MCLSLAPHIEPTARAYSLRYINDGSDPKQQQTI